ncbi:hypothetical protein GCM10025883_39690 [Mobilicoccus caccae]|uniref:YrhK domain-containing protein n=2 Tax=Mobilicoccus caccae TaxID=1859295 RepID=A0ABQ6IYY3_9MICO|nr:hypothetical protein GCM10025883_39690 [Mobilicoccus caccae]
MVAMTSDRSDLSFRVGREEIRVRRRYEVLSIANDIVIGLWFLIGSILFFSESTTFIGTWLFVVGSAQMLIRPGIRMTRHVHLTRIGSRTPDSRRDY